MPLALVIEDSPELGEFVADGLRIHGYAIKTAKNGKEALKILESLPVDVVLTDIQMPVMDGLEFIKQARLKFPDLPIYAMTDFPPYPKEEILRAGATECTDKLRLLELFDFLGGTQKKFR